MNGIITNSLSLTLSTRGEIFHLYILFARVRFPEFMACTHAIIHAIHILELRNSPQSLFTEWGNVLKRVQHQSFQQVPKSHIMILRETLEYLDHALLHTHPYLYALNRQVAVFDMRVFFVFIHNFPSRDAHKDFFCIVTLLLIYLGNNITCISEKINRDQLSLFAQSM